MLSQICIFPLVQINPWMFSDGKPCGTDKENWLNKIKDEDLILIPGTYPGNQS